jgi:hypothetical protein
MNSIDFTQPGGFPLDQDVFGFQQTNIFMAAQAANLAGTLAILSGCVVAGNQVGNGYVVINGEILSFVGGIPDAKVSVIQTTENMNYEDGTPRPSQITRYATFGDDGVTTLLWANFKRNTAEGVLSRLERLEFLAAPFIMGGGMVLFKKAAMYIPAGWREVVDWRGRLPMGYDPTNPLFDEPDVDFGGSVNHTITKSEIPTDLAAPLPMAGNDNGTGAVDAGSGNAGTLNVNLGGGGQAFSLLNPYRVVVFIEPDPTYYPAV